MKKSRTQYIIWGSVIAIGIVILITTIVRNQKKKEIQAIYDAINSGTDENGNYTDLVGSDGLSTSYWQQFTISDADKNRANILAQDIYDALGYFQSDDVQKVLSSIQSAGSKAELSYVSYIFQQKFGKSLYSHLQHLGTDDLNKINDVIKNLPNS